MSNKPVPIENAVIADGSRMGGAIKPQVASIRKMFGLTQAGFAKEVGVSRVTVARWEAGGSHPRLRDLQSMLKVVHRHLLELAVNSFLAALDRSTAEKIRTDVTARLSLKTEYWAVALLLGGDARMTLDQWCALFYTTTDVLSALPVATHRDGEAFYWGYDIGLALEAAVRGRTYAQFVDTMPDEETALTLGGTRLSSELLQLMSMFAIMVDNWPLNSKEMEAVVEAVKGT